MLAKCSSSPGGTGWVRLPRPRPHLLSSPPSPPYPCPSPFDPLWLFPTARIPIPTQFPSQFLVPITASTPSPAQDLALPTALCTTGQGPPILPGPVVVQGGFSTGLAPQCDRTALWHRRARWVDTDSKQGWRAQRDTGLASHSGVPCVAWSTPVGYRRRGCRG